MLCYQGTVHSTNKEGEPPPVGLLFWSSVGWVNGQRRAGRKCPQSSTTQTLAPLLHPDQGSSLRDQQSLTCHGSNLILDSIGQLTCIFENLSEIVGEKAKTVKRSLPNTQCQTNLTKSIVSL